MIPRVVLCNGAIAILALGWASIASAAVDAANENAGQPSAGNGMYSTYKESSPRFFDEELRDTHPIPMEELLPSLMKAINYLSKYSLPETLPPIHRVPHERIEEIACGRPCAALAAYRADEGIYLDDALVPESNLFARSVLLHELVHYVQEEANELAGARPCERWYRREQEAYAIQKYFLAFVGSQMRVGYSAGSTCTEGSS